jgi:hypothetical protein
VDPLEVALDRNRLVAFDGRVLEVFGGAVRRFHVNLLTVTVPQPDKKGNVNVTLTQAGIDVALPLDSSMIEKVQPILVALRSAGANVVG